jgi:hypothetical protein
MGNVQTVTSVCQSHHSREWVRDDSTVVVSAVFNDVSAIGSQMQLCDRDTELVVNRAATVVVWSSQLAVRS